MANQLTIKEVKVRAGDTVRINYIFREGDKEKKQAFEGIVIKVRGRGGNQMFTIRKMTRAKIGVERIIPVASPFIDSISVLKKGNARRANLGFIRGKSDREIRERLYS